MLKHSIEKHFPDLAHRKKPNAYLLNEYDFTIHIMYVCVCSNWRKLKEYRFECFEFWSEINCSSNQNETNTSPNQPLFLEKLQKKP